MLFLKKMEGERELLELPCMLVEKGRNPVAELKEAVMRKTAIDAQVHEPALEGKYNAGSRKKKKWIPALGFRTIGLKRRRWCRCSTCRHDLTFLGWKSNMRWQANSPIRKSGRLGVSP